MTIIIQLSSNIMILPSSNEIETSIDGGITRTKIEPKTMNLLHYLVTHQGNVCDPEDLIRLFWDGNSDVGKPALRKNIYKLKRELNKLGLNECIETIPKKGYRLKKQITESKLNNLYYFRQYKFVIVGVIILLAIKLIFPDIIHSITHRLSH